MELPPELTRIPFESLDVLRYMGAANVEAAPSEALATGAGLSDRGIRKAIRGLITKGYLNMDASNIYFLTDKGYQAIQDIIAYDAANPARTNQAAQTDNSILLDLVAVLSNPLGAGANNRLIFGLNAAPEIEHPADLILRFSASGGRISPDQVTLALKPGQLPQPTATHFIPANPQSAVRIRVEVMQLSAVSDQVTDVGGMFFDVAIGQQAGAAEAWYGSLSLQP